jgi:hypothetical protein
MNGTSKGSTAMLTLILVISTSIILHTPVAAQPRTDDLVIFFCATVQDAFNMLVTDDADICGYEIDNVTFRAAIDDLNIALAPVAAYDMFQIDINNNWTIPTFPGVRSPTSYREFRRAMALLTDRDFIVEDICGGFAEQIDQPIAAPSAGWMNENSSGANYPWQFDTVAAAAMLDAAGFVEGTTPNPDFDPAFPGSTEHLRIDPATGVDMNPLICFVRNDDLRMLFTGRMLGGNLRRLGVPCDVTEGPLAVCFGPVMGAFNYHWYTGGWSLGRFPTYVYNLYNNDWYSSFEPNYVTGVNALGLPNYPELDETTHDLYCAATFGESVTACQDAMWVFTDECVTIPLFSSVAFWAYRREVMGVVNMVGAGLENGYTFMNAYKEDGSALRYAIKAAPTAMNVLYSSWYYDRQVLDRLTLYGGIATAPYERARDQGGFVQDWYVDTWNNGTDDNSKVTYWLRNDAFFVEPVTGTQRENVNMTAWLMSAFIQHACDDCWLSSEYADVDHFVLIDEDGDGDVFDDYCVEVYYTDLSYWFTYLCGGALLPPRVWLQPSGPLTSYQTEMYTMDFPDTVPLTGEIAWIDEVTYDGTPLTMFTDYNWVEGELVINTFLAGGTVQVNYWRMGNARGFWPGGLNFAINPEIIEGAGMYYLTAYTAGVGGSARFLSNPNYWMDTPPLGEIDFWWVWGPTDETRRIDVDRCPRTGWYIVDMGDMDYVGLAFGTQGTGIPDLFWFPGADLAPDGGTVNIFDAVTVAGHWTEEHSETP